MVRGSSRSALPRQSVWDFREKEVKPSPEYLRSEALTFDSGLFEWYIVFGQCSDGRCFLLPRVVGYDLYPNDDLVLETLDFTVQKGIEFLAYYALDPFNREIVKAKDAAIRSFQRGYHYSPIVGFAKADSEEDRKHPSVQKVRQAASRL